MDNIILPNKQHIIIFVKNTDILTHPTKHNIDILHILVIRTKTCQSLFSLQMIWKKYTEAWQHILYGFEAC